jgi:hypothetical protein
MPASLIRELYRVLVESIFSAAPVLATIDPADIRGLSTA